MATSRRQFIQIGAAGTGAAVLGSGLTSNMWGLTPDETHDPQTDGDKVVSTFCEVCFWKCGVRAHVKDGRVTKIEGNPKHPLSNGRLCPRGTGGAGLLYDPDRLKTPLMRVEERGAQVFKPVSWDEALDHIAKKMLEIRDEHGAEALAMFSHGYGASWFKGLMKAYGTGSITHPSYAQCRGARAEAFSLTFGEPVGSPERLDIENTRVLTLIGSHLGENMHNTQVQEFAAAIGKGCQLVVVDPRFSTAAGKARHWLPIKPGTDIALLLAWMHVIVNERLYDVDFVEQHTVGFEELKAHLADKTPEWAFVHTSIPPEQIVETARFIAGGRPGSLIHPGRRYSWNGQDAQRGRAIAILNALLGSWGQRGGFFVPDKIAIPSIMPKIKHAEPRTPPDMPNGTVYPFASDVLAHGLRDASVPGADVPYPIKGWFVYGTNLMQSLPDRDQTIEALKALDFVVAIDVLPAEITGWADVVLPEATYLERYDDLHAPAWKRPFMAMRQPVVEPQHDSKPGWWIAKELSKRMGYPEVFPWDNVEDYLSERLGKMGLTLAEMKEKGVIEGDPVPTFYDQGIAPSFPTPSGKVELYSQQMADAGLLPLPDYRPPDELSPGEFLLVTGRAPSHTFGRTTNNRLLSEVCDDNPLWLNARVAAEMGLTNKDRVVLSTRDGLKSAPFTLLVTQRIRHDTVYTVHGYGHHSKMLTFANERGASAIDLVRKPPIDPVMGATGLNSAVVRIERHIA